MGTAKGLGSMVMENSGLYCDGVNLKHMKIWMGEDEIQSDYIHKINSATVNKICK